MPHRDTSLAINKLSISIPNDGLSNVLNATEGHNPCYTTSYISIPNDWDTLTCLSKQGFSLATHKLDIDFKLTGTICT